MLAMMFGQLSNRESLRDLIVALEEHRAKQYHLGLGLEPIAKTTLATANQNRDYRIFEDFAFYTVTVASKHDSTAMSSIHYEPNAYYIFDRAYDSFKELYRIHLTESYNVLTDAEVKLTGYLSEKKYPESFRLIRYYDEEDDREFTFLTNAKNLSALDVANLYKKRWLVELFFSYCLVAIVQHDMKLKRSTYEVLQILSISLTDKTHLRDLFDKTDFNDVKDLSDSLIPGLFD